MTKMLKILAIALAMIAIGLLGFVVSAATLTYLDMTGSLWGFVPFIVAGVWSGDFLSYIWEAGSLEK